MKTILRVSVAATLVAFGGCCSWMAFDGAYPETVSEDFTDCADVSALVTAWEKGANFVARFEYLPGKRGAAPAKYLKPLADNVGRQIWGKDANFAGNGSYERKADMWNFEEVRYLGGCLEVWLNGYLVSTAAAADLGENRAATRWIGFTGGEEVRNLRIRELPACAKPGCGCPKMRMACPKGFTAYFDGDKSDLAEYWKGVTTEEKFDNPIVRQAATDAKRAEMQKLADKGRDEHWSVIDGTLHFDGFKGGYSLATKEDYEDFELWADWRLLSVSGDSGLYLRGTPQVQIWDAHNQWNIGSGGLYNNEKNPSKALVIADRRIGDWNRFHVIMQGDKVTVWLNGELVVDHVKLENFWDRKRPIFFKEQIELQCHGDPTEWRNVFIRPLPTVKVASDRVGACSWSWRKDLRGVAAEMDKAGISGIHLALGPFIHADGRHGDAEGAESWAFVKEQVRSGKWKLMSTMVGTVGEDYSTLETIRKTGGIVPDAHWAENQAIVTKGAQLTKELGCRYMSLHAGFLDESDPAAFKTYVERVSWMRDEAAKYGVTIILESGQETAEDLAKFMEAVPGIYINFDPANMILYGKGRPMEAVKTLLPWIRQVHVKDALFTEKPGTWGTEVAWGEGAVGGRSFIAALEALGYTGNYVIEREGGDARVKEINLAKDRLEK